MHKYGRFWKAVDFGGLVNWIGPTYSHWSVISFLIFTHGTFRSAVERVWHVGRGKSIGLFSPCHICVYSSNSVLGLIVISSASVPKPGNHSTEHQVVRQQDKWSTVSLLVECTNGVHLCPNSSHSQWLAVLLGSCGDDSTFSMCIGTSSHEKFN